MNLRSVKTALLRHFGHNGYKLLDKSTGAIFKLQDIILLCDSSQVDSAAKSLRVTKKTWWSSQSIVLSSYTSMLFAFIYINGILQSVKKLLVQFSCLSFYK